MKTAFGKNLRALREAKNMTQRKLAKKINVTHATIANYENAGKYPQKDKIRKDLITALECSEVDLYGYGDGYYSQTHIIDSEYKGDTKVKSISVNKANEDDPEVIETCIYNFEDNKLSKVKRQKRAIDKNIVKKHKNGYFIHLEDDSMDRYIARDSYVFIDPDGDKDKYDEHICALTIDGYKTIIRRIKYLDIDNLVTLIPQSNNDKYQTQTVNIEDNEDFKILGYAVWFSNDGIDL